MKIYSDDSLWIIYSISVQTKHVSFWWWESPRENCIFVFFFRFCILVLNFCLKSLRKYIRIYRVVRIFNYFIKNMIQKEAIHRIYACIFMFELKIFKFEPSYFIFCCTRWKRKKLLNRKSNTITHMESTTKIDKSTCLRISLLLQQKLWNREFDIRSTNQNCHNLLNKERHEQICRLCYWPCASW